MKKLFVFAASAMMVFASCTDNEIVYQNETPQEIGLFSVVDNMTRANVKGANSGNEFPFENMQVAAYLAEITGNNPMDYFDGTTFSGAGTSFTGGKYWPIQDAVINFMAIAPVESTVVTKFGEEEDNSNPVKYKNYAKKATVTVTNNYVNQYDVMYAVGQGKKTSATPDDVSMQFNHALAWVNFTFKSSTPGITINSVTITNGKYSGTLTVTNSNYTSVDAYTTSLEAEPSWNAEVEADKTVTGEPITFIADNDNATPPVVGNLNNAIPWDTGILVVPCNPTSFVVNYTITADGENHEYNYTYPITDGENQTFAWAMGKKYTYNISMGLAGITIAPTVTDWDSDINGNGNDDDEKDITIN